MAGHYRNYATKYSASMNTSFFGTIVITPRTFSVRTETKIRTYTFPNALALLCGAWSGAIGLYVIWFGSKSLSPWCCVQSYCYFCARKTRSQLREAFPTMSLQFSMNLSLPDLSTDLSASSNNSLSQKLTVEKRLDALELLLKEYVIDLTYLKNLNDDKYSNKT
ncbi:6958_t:CDS:2, partial [Paraglomus occultum]